MATTSFTIYSHYNPETDKERLEIETGQVPTPKPFETHVGIGEGEGESEDEGGRMWREATSASFLRRQRLPPKFVPATISYEVGSYQPRPFNSPPSPQNNPLGNDLSSWYRSIIKSDDGPNFLTTHSLKSTTRTKTTTTSTLPSPSATSFPSSSSPSLKPNQTSRSIISQPDKKDKNNWFIQKILQSERSNNTTSSSSSLSSTPVTTTTPTIADILSREPPPLPSEPKYKPPVWIEIGPSNKGFIMLQKGGWNEGEALGPNVVRQRHPKDSLTLLSESESKFNEAMSNSNSTAMSVIKKGKQKQRTETLGTEKRIKQEENNVLGQSKEQEREVIDLTLSDDDNESSCSETDAAEVHGLAPTIEDISAHGRKALLTPIATVLKLDRLGIGLKAKTEGPYKASVKRVTHNAAALSAHIGAAEEARRRRDKFGRGRRGFDRQKRKEEDKRRDLLAYMNS